MRFLCRGWYLALIDLISSCLMQGSVSSASPCRLLGSQHDPSAGSPALVDRVLRVSRVREGRPSPLGQEVPLKVFWGVGWGCGMRDENQGGVSGAGENQNGTWAASGTERRTEFSEEIYEEEVTFQLSFEL